MKTRIGLAIGIRIGFILIIVPTYQERYFAPFLNDLKLSVDVWSQWVTSGGHPQAFPYGVAMVIAYLPSLISYKLLGLVAISGYRTLEVLIGLQMLILECLLWRHIKNSKKMELSLNTFLFSPIIIWVNYFLGLNDFFPSVCLFFSAYFLLGRRYRTAGAFIGIAIGMKYSLALILPFLILFAWDNPRFKDKIWNTVTVASTVGALFYLPGLYSLEFREMVFRNKESTKAFGYFVTLGSNKLLLLPLIYIFLLYWLWKAGRISINVLISFFGVALFLISAFSPASLGWMLWGLPLMFLNLAKEKKSRVQLLAIQCIFLLHSLMMGFELQTKFGLLSIAAANSRVTDLLFTTGIVLIIIYSYSSLKLAIRHGDRYKIANAPLTISIAGDSGTGKDTLTQAITNMFTPNTVTTLCGDDYHKYERGDISWKNTTHLNPTANYLDLWEKDFNLAFHRVSFQQREYDHESGRFSPLRPRLRRDVLISQGLHGLYPRLVRYSDIRIFLSMDDELRIKLKLARDSKKRGHTFESVLESIKKRETDYRSFVAPQKENADIHFHLYEVGENVRLRVASTSNVAVDEFMKNISTLSNVQIDESEKFNRKIYDLEPKGLDSVVLQKILRMQVSDFDQLFLEEPCIPANDLGIMATLTLIMVAIKRGEFYE